MKWEQTGYKISNLIALLESLLTQLVVNVHSPGGGLNISPEGSFYFFFLQNVRTQARTYVMRKIRLTRQVHEKYIKRFE